MSGAEQAEVGGPLPCPACGHGTSGVKDSRPSHGAMIRRRRACTSCGHRFTTYERVARTGVDWPEDRRCEECRYAVDNVEGGIAGHTHSCRLGPRPLQVNSEHWCWQFSPRVEES